MESTGINYPRYITLTLYTCQDTPHEVPKPADPCLLSAKGESALVRDRFSSLSSLATTRPIADTL